MKEEEESTTTQFRNELKRAIKIYEDKTGLLVTAIEIRMGKHDTMGGSYYLTKEVNIQATNPEAL